MNLKKTAIALLVVLGVLAFGFRAEIADYLSREREEDHQEQIERDDHTPSITGPKTCGVGELVTFSVSGAPAASWSVTPALPLYVDSTTVTIAFSSPRKGTFVIFAAVAVDDTPEALSTSVVVGDGESDHGGKTDGDGEQKKTNLDAAIASAMPPSDETRALLLAAFDAALSEIEKDGITTTAGAFAVLRHTTIDCLKDPSAATFLDAITPALRAELEASGDTLPAVTALFRRVADALRPGTNARAPPQSDVRSVTPSAPAARSAPRNASTCPSGNCPLK